jgi:hypothetical protein
MNTYTGKTIYSRIATLAREISRDMGVKSHMARGTVLAAARKIYDAEPSIREGLDFDTWYVEVVTHGMKRITSESTVEAPAHRGRTAAADSMQNRYIEMAQQRDWLPPDEVLNRRWGCKDGTLSSIRSLAKKYGYAFALDPDGWRVIQRPDVMPAIKRPRKPSELQRKEKRIAPEVLPVPEQLQVSAPELPAQPTLIPEIAHADTTLEDLFRELISVMRRAWGVVD